jgi:hypothetical protein
MKRTALVLIFILALFSALVGAQVVRLAEANPTMFQKDRYCHISIQSPQGGSTIKTEPAFLNFTVKKAYVPDAYSYFCLLDGQDVQSGVKVEEMQLVGQETISEEHLFDYVEDTLTGHMVLPNLSNGNHNVTVFIGQTKDDGTIQPANIEPFSFSVNFSVDTTAPFPSPAAETPLNSEPFPTTFVATASLISIAVASFGLFLRFKKRKSDKL